MTYLASDDSSAQPGFAELLAILRNHRGALLAVALGASLLAGMLQYIRPLRYTSRTEFIPQARGQGSLAAGFAAQLGVSLPGQDPAQSPSFYADLARAPEILSSVIRAGVKDRAGRRVSYASYYHLEEADTAVAREVLIDRLAADITSSVAQKTGVVALAMRAKDPVVAQATLANVLSALEVYNSVSRRSQATAERHFAERRLNEIRGELAAAEDALMQFLQGNRDSRNSSTLTFQQERLARTVALKQQVFVSLSQAVEQARLEEIRDTPVLSVVQPPSLPARPDPRGVLRMAALGLVLSFGGAVVACAGFLFARDLLASRANQERASESPAGG